MNSIESVLRDLGKEIGIAALSPEERGSVAVKTESGRQLGLERADGTVLVHLSEPVSHEACTWLLRAWQRAHYSQAGNAPIQAALRERDGEQRLLALVRIHETEFTVPRLQQALDHLSRWLDALRHD